MIEPKPWTPGVHRCCAETAERLAAVAIKNGQIGDQYYWLSVAAVHREADRAEQRPVAA